jgi:hypothetical protein
LSVKFCGGIEGIEEIDRIEGRSYIFFFAEACCGAGGEASIVEH